MLCKSCKKEHAKGVCCHCGKWNEKDRGSCYYCGAAISKEKEEWFPENSDYFFKGSRESRPAPSFWTPWNLPAGGRLDHLYVEPPVKSVVPAIEGRMQRDDEAENIVGCVVSIAVAIVVAVLVTVLVSGWVG